MIDRYGHSPADPRAPSAQDFSLTPGWFCRALIISSLAVWVLQSFLQAMLDRMCDGGRPLAAVHALHELHARAPEAQRHAADLHLPDDRVRTRADGVCRRRPAPRSEHADSGDRRRRPAWNRPSSWLARPADGRAWAMARWQSELAHPGTLMLWLQRTDPAVLARLGPITRSVHGAPRDQHQLRNPAAVLLLSGWPNAGAGLHASAAPAARRRGRDTTSP